MNLKFFGDSYDIVKKSLIEWLGTSGAWVTHPMFTAAVSGQEAQAFANFLRTPLISTSVLTSKTDRLEYFSPCYSTGNLFLDPDTGVRITKVGGHKSINYVFASELLGLAEARPSSLTLVFDQSFARGGAHSAVEAKLKHFANYGISSVLYSSHAPFLLVSQNVSLIDRAYDALLENSRLPASRLVRLR